MAHRQVGFDDERRRSTYGATGSPRSDLYRLRDSRERDRDRDRDRDQDRDTGRDVRDDRRGEIRPGHSSDRRESATSARSKDNDPKARTLPPLNTNIENSQLRAPTAAASSALTCDSPTSSLTGSITKAATMLPPKSQDPQLQDVVTLLYKLLDYAYWRNNYNSERNQRKKEFEKRKSETEKYLGRTDQFPQQMDIIQKARDRDKAELDKVEVKYKSSEQKFMQYVEAVAAKIVKSKLSQPAVAPETAVQPVPEPHPSIAELAAKFAAFQKDTTHIQGRLREDLAEVQNENVKVRNEFNEIQTVNKMLQTNGKTSQDRIKQLELGLETERTRTNKVNEQAKGLESRVQQLLDEKSILNSDIGELRRRLKKHGTETSEIRETVKTLDSSVKNINWNAERQALRQRITELQQDLKLSAEQSASAKKEVDSIHTSVARLENRITSCLEHGNTQKDIGDVRDRVATLEMAKKRHEETLAKHQTHLDQLKVVENKASILGEQISNLQTRINAFDPEGLSKIQDDWTLLDINNAIPAYEVQLEKVEENIKELLSSIKSIEHKSSASNVEAPSRVEQDAITKDIDALKSDAKRFGEDLKSKFAQLRQEFSAVQSEMKDIKPSVLATISGTFEEQEVAVAEMIEGTNKETAEQFKAIVTRVDTLESKGIQARTPAPTPQLDTHVSPVAIDTELADRVKALEDEQFGAALKQTQLVLEERILGFDQRQESFSAELAKFQEQVQDCKNALERLRGDVTGQLDQQELQLQNLNNHFSNINTEGMAKIVLGQLNTHITKIQPKIEQLAHRVSRMEHHIRAGESAIQNGPPVQELQQSNKRPAASQSGVDMGSNKRRMTPSGSLHVSASTSNQ